MGRGGGTGSAGEEAREDGTTAPGPEASMRDDRPARSPASPVEEVSRPRIMRALSGVLGEMQTDALAIQSALTDALSGPGATEALPPGLQRLDHLTQRLGALSTFFAVLADDPPDDDLRAVLQDCGLESLEARVFRAGPKDRGTPGDVALF